MVGGQMLDMLTEHKELEESAIIRLQRMKTGSLADVRALSGYVLSKSGKLYAVTSFINHPNAWRGLEAHDQLLSWLLEDGPEPKHAR
jgi:D-alanyl-D-alanine carboxypeptidase/D-alanyl-D-alanine-endopeptidase (penicillin-binding protein 4)